MKPERPFGQGDELHRHVDVDHRHRRVNVVLDDVEIDLDVLAFRDPIDVGGQTNGHIRRYRLSVGHGCVRGHLTPGL